MHRLRRFLFYLQSFVTAIVIDHCILFCMLMRFIPHSHWSRIIIQYACTNDVFKDVSHSHWLY